MKYESPDLGNPDQPRDVGVVDVNEDTLADRATVADIRDHLRKRDRNAKPRAGGDYPRDAA